jgi:hypothetical protein
MYLSLSFSGQNNLCFSILGRLFSSSTGLSGVISVWDVVGLPSGTSRTKERGRVGANIDSDLLF